MKQVLLIDDDADFLEVLTFILEESGFQVHPQSLPSKALEDLSGYAPDAIVVDYDMPIMNGLTFTQKVRKRPLFTTIPIIMMSAHREASDLVSDSGASAFLSKPFD